MPYDLHERVELQRVPKKSIKVWTINSRVPEFRTLCSWAKSTTFLIGAMCLSSQIPESKALMRPLGVTPVASMQMRPAPPRAKPPRWTKCHSVNKPSTDEYWHLIKGVFVNIVRFDDLEFERTQVRWYLHRRNHNAILQFNAADLKRCKK